MKISASIYSTDHKTLPIEAIRELEEYFVDYWHIDCNDDESVFEDIDFIHQNSSIPVDLHIISDNIEKYTEKIQKSKLHRVSYQVENLPMNVNLPKFENTQVGLAIQVGNPNLNSIIETHQDSIDFVLLMMTTPGKSGGIFDSKDFQTIRQCINRFPKLNWCIDGGVNHEISYILRLLGVESIVVGSFLMKNPNLAQAMLQIRSRRVKSNFKIADFMTLATELPIIDSQATFGEMIKTLDQYNLGTVFCEKQGELVGIITNADIRKHLLKGTCDFDKNITDLININPKMISSQASTTDMLEYIDTISFPILVLPVVHETKKLVGAVLFHKLLKEDF